MARILSQDVVTEDFERIDRLAKRLYGTEQDGTLEALLNANPGLAELALANGCYLPFGTLVNVPEKPVPEAAKINRPWE